MRVPKRAIRRKEGESDKKRQAPGITPEAREQQLVRYAFDLAEKQLLDGTASSQVITHFAKIGATMMELEKEKLRKENLLLEAKTETLKSAKRSEELFANALKAMKSYSGQEATSVDAEVVDDED